MRITVSPSLLSVSLQSLVSLGVDGQEVEQLKALPLDIIPSRRQRAVERAPERRHLGPLSGVRREQISRGGQPGGGVGIGVKRTTWSTQRERQRSAQPLVVPLRVVQLGLSAREGERAGSILEEGVPTGI